MPCVLEQPSVKQDWLLVRSRSLFVTALLPANNNAKWGWDTTSLQLPHQPEEHFPTNPSISVTLFSASTSTGPLLIALDVGGARLDTLTLSFPSSLPERACDKV